MKKHLLATFLLILGFVAFLNAQTRYVEEVFDDVTVEENVKYGTNISIMPVILGAGNPAPEDLLMEVGRILFLRSGQDEDLADAPALVSEIAAR